VRFIFVSAAVASEDRRIAVINAAAPVISETSAEPRENIARQKRERGTTVWRKTAAAMGWVSFVKKTWMIQVQQCCPYGVSLYYCGSKTAFFASKRHLTADFAGSAAGSFRPSPAEGMVKRQKEEWVMIKKKILNPDRVRCIQGGFSFVPHRFLADGFFASLSPHELLLYFLLVLASDRNGVSFYSYDKICTLLQMALDRYLMARDSLIDKDLIAFDGTLFQVLQLPEKPVVEPKSKPGVRLEQEDKLVYVGNIFQDLFKDG
jgi:hypothetical protein